MFFSSWTLLQDVIIALLIVLAFTADMFRKDIGVPFSSSNEINTSVLMVALFLVVTIGLLSLLMYFQMRKSETFLEHRLWDKMYVIMPVILIVSLIVIFIFVLINPLNDIIEGSRWIIYVFIYYILLLINASVLAIIHRIKKKTVTNEKKILYSFIWTSLGLLVVIFIL